jgi:pimeloyl-ACP methyl ester carboxylesterase
MSHNVCDRSAMLGGLRFHYREWPNPGAQALVLLHGFTGHARSWDSFATAMQANHHVYALDQRGHGDSDWTDDYSAESMVEDVQRWVTALGLKQFVLLGLSMGGRNAYQFAATHPEEVERLVIVDIGPEIASAGSNRIMTGVQASDVFTSPEEALERARAANARADEAEQVNRTLNNLMLLEDGTWTFRYDKGLRDGSRPLARPDAGDGWGLLAKITAPTLLIRGELSDVLDAGVAERMCREIADCRFAVVPGAGHSIPLESPKGFLEAVRTFL